MLSRGNEMPDDMQELTRKILMDEEEAHAGGSIPNVSR